MRKNTSDVRSSQALSSPRDPDGLGRGTPDANPGGSELKPNGILLPSCAGRPSPAALSCLAVPLSLVPALVAGTVAAAAIQVAGISSDAGPAIIVKTALDH